MTEGTPELLPSQVETVLRAIEWIQGTLVNDQEYVVDEHGRKVAMTEFLAGRAIESGVKEVCDLIAGLHNALHFAVQMWANETETSKDATTAQLLRILRQLAGVPT